MANLERIEMDGVTVLKLCGSLSCDEIAGLEQSFRDAARTARAAVVVDLSGVDFLATPAISMFMAAAQEIKSTGGRIAVSGPQPRIGTVLHRLHLDATLPVCSTVSEAIGIVKKT